MHIQHPEGYRYSRFCELYRGWLRRQEFVLRQEYRAGEKLFVDTRVQISCLTPFPALRTLGIAQL